MAAWTVIGFMRCAASAAFGQALVLASQSVPYRSQWSEVVINASSHAGPSLDPAAHCAGLLARSNRRREESCSVSAEADKMDECRH